MGKTSKAKDLMSVRPQLPSFTQISEDISCADDDDVIFSDCKIGTQQSAFDDHESADNRVPAAPVATGARLISQSAAAGDSGQAKLESSLPSVDAVYRQALEFIASTQQLKAELSRDKDTRGRLTEAVAVMSSSLEAMRSRVEDLRAATRTVSITQADEHFVLLDK